MRVQRALIAGHRAIAQEFPPSIHLADFPPQRVDRCRRHRNTSRSRRMVFARTDPAGRQAWSRRPLEVSLDALRTLPTRTQVTRHDCVEGWSVIGKWSGVPLSHLLDLARPRPGARYVVFHCFDDLSGDGSRYYESIDLLDAYHPQTLVAHSLNGSPVPVANGAPVRMRIERKLGYKQPKYVRLIEVVDGYGALGRGRGGYWEDQGYDWWGGI